MNNIVKEIEMISRKLREIEEKVDLKNDSDMNLIWWKWHEERRGLIKACAMMGIIVEAQDAIGIKWAIHAA